MWQRFTERSRRVVFRAQEEAGLLNSSAVSPAHMLLAVLHQDDSVAARVLHRMDISREQLSAQVRKHIPQGDGGVTSINQLTPDAKRVIDLAYDEARQLSNNYIGTEHLLLGLIREGMDNYRAVNGRVLKDAGLELERTRREVLAYQNNDNGIASNAEQDEPLASAAQALSSSRIAGRIFNREYQALAPQQQMTMQTTGLRMSELSPMMRELLRFTMQTAQSETQNDVQTIRDADELMRVRVETLPDGLRYHVTSDVTLLTTMLVRDDTP